MKRIAFVTSSEDPALTQDDLLALPALRDLNISVEPLIWDKAPDIGAYDALIFRSCWDYHLKHERFVSFLESLRSSRAPVWNSPAVLLWNLNKKHIFELEAKGVAAPKTRWILKGAKFSASTVDWPCEKVVLKPAVSLNGYDTFLVDANDTASLSSKAAAILAKGDLLVQEYLPEIKTSGELSFLFFNGEFSHAVRELPRSGEFRIHEAYGGSRTAVSPSADLIAQASLVVEAIPEDTLYARVDVVEREGRLILIELEALDPSLFLGNDSVAAKKFADAVAARLR